MVTSAMLRTWPVSCGHRVHAFGQIFQTPSPRNCAWPPSLPSVPHFARDARHLGGEHAELLDHRIDDVGRLQELAANGAVDIQFDGLQQVSLGNRGNGSVTSRVGHSKSSISVLTEPSMSAMIRWQGRT